LSLRPTGGLEERGSLVAQAAERHQVTESREARPTNFRMFTAREALNWADVAD